MCIAISMILAGILPMPLVYLLRRFQILKVDLDIHQGSIRRNETTASTKEMIDQDDDVSKHLGIFILILMRPSFFMTHDTHIFATTKFYILWLWRELSCYECYVEIDFKLFHMFFRFNNKNKTASKLCRLVDKLFSFSLFPLHVEILIIH
jgi:hypothetical protein